MQTYYRLLVFCLMGPTFASCQFSQSVVFDSMDTVEVLRGDRDIHAERRNLQVAGQLPSNAVSQFREYVVNGRKKSLGYVLSEYYLQLDNQIIGVVEKSDGTLIGFDVTTDDVSTLPVTSIHRVIINKDFGDGRSLLNAIKSVDRSVDR